jgi:hypothetical protein
MKAREIEATLSAWWGRIVLIAAIVGGLYLVVDKYRDIDEGVAESTEHVATHEPRVEELTQTVGDVVEDLATQRASDAEFRDKALNTIGEGFSKHDERITGLEDRGKEQQFILREQRALRVQEQRRIDALEQEQRAQRAESRAALEVLRDVSRRPIVVTPPPSVPE